MVEAEVVVAAGELLSGGEVVHQATATAITAILVVILKSKERNLSAKLLWTRGMYAL